MRRAPHAREIEYVFEALSSKDLPWRPKDQKVCELTSSYWTNFAKTGDPNGEGLPHWPAYNVDGYQVMHLAAEPHALPHGQHAPYVYLDQIQQSNWQTLADSGTFAGYADQSHMTREVHRFTGRPPTAVLKTAKCTVRFSDLLDAS